MAGCWQELTGTKMFFGEPKSWVGKSAPRFLTSVCAWGLSLFLLAVAGSVRAIADDAKKAEKEKPEAVAAEKETPAERRVFLVNVPLPIVDQVDAKVIAQITALLPSEANAGAAAAGRSSVFAKPRCFGPQ